MKGENVMEGPAELKKVPGGTGWGELKYLWRSDLYRYTGKTGFKIFLHRLLRNPGFRYTFFFRLCSYLNDGKDNLAKRVLFIVFREVLLHYAIKYGISIPYGTRVESGLYIGHYGGIVVNADSIIGKNCNLMHGVTIGQANRGERRGSPIIGDNVFIGAGAVLIGKIKVGNNVAIGTSAVVTTDIPDNAVVVGIPAKVISYEGSEGYVNRTDYR